MRLLISCVALILAATTASAQVTFAGPETGKPNKMNIVTLTEVKGDDLKISAFFDGRPSLPGDWLFLKNENNQNIILVLTEKEGVFTFVGAVNKGSKTFLTSHTMTMGTPAPKPDPEPAPDDKRPKPTPETDFSTKLKAAYKVSPDASALAKMIQIFEEVSSKSYLNYDQMEVVLQATAKRFLADSDLRKSRDTIADELIKRFGDDPRKRDVEKVKAFYKEVLTILKGL